MQIFNSHFLSYNFTMLRCSENTNTNQNTRLLHRMSEKKREKFLADNK